jgi:hypothetical protein
VFLWWRKLQLAASTSVVVLGGCSIIAGHSRACHSTADEFRFFETKTGPVGVSRGTTSNVWRSPKLLVGERAGVSIDKLAREALTFAENERQMMGQMVSRNSAGLVGVDNVTIHHVLTFSLSFEREVDKRQFETQKQFLLLKAPPLGVPSFLPLNFFSRGPTFKEYCNAKGCPSGLASALD